MYFPVPLDNHVLFTAILKNHVSEDTEVFVCDDYSVMVNVACGCCFDFHFAFLLSFILWAGFPAPFALDVKEHIHAEHTS